MARILGDDNTNNAVPLIVIITLVPTGTRLHVKFSNGITHFHIVQTALTTLEFMAELNKKYGHMPKVVQIESKATQVGLALELMCI